MSYHFSIIGTRDNPLFDLEFGTSKLGSDGTAHFRPEAKSMNQFIVHAALDIVEEVQWSTKDLYLKRVDTFQNNHVHCFLTGGNVKFMLLTNPDPNATTYAAYQQQQQSGSRPGTGQGGARQSTSSLAANPTSQATEETVRQFMMEVYEAWVKCIMNPFYSVNQAVTSPVFKARVATAAKKYL